MSSISDAPINAPSKRSSLKRGGRRLTEHTSMMTTKAENMFQVPTETITEGEIDHSKIKGKSKK